MFQFSILTTYTLTLTFSLYVMLTSMLFIKHVGFKFNPVVAVDIESLYYILRLLKCARDKEETIQPSTNIETATLSKKMW